MSTLDKLYGLKPYTLEEELSLPDAVRRTRNNKVVMVDHLLNMKNLSESLSDWVRTIPELDDESHAGLVDKLAAAVNEAYRAFDMIYIAKKGEGK